MDVRENNEKRSSGARFANETIGFFSIQMETVFNLSLTNDRLYAGCDIEEVAGRLALVTPLAEAVNIVGRNARPIIDELVADGTEELTLSGPMAIWAYLVVFHIAVHRFRRIYYDDGKPNGKVLIAVH